MVIGHLHDAVLVSASCMAVSTALELACPRHLRFFEEVLEVNEEINVQSVKQHVDALNENIELWLTSVTIWLVFIFI